MNMAESSVPGSKRKYSQNDKYTLAEKHQLGKLVEQHKKEYDDKLKKLDGKEHYDYKRKKHVLVTPKGGFVAKAVRKYFNDLCSVKHDDTQLKSACKLAKRCHDMYLKNEYQPQPSEAKRFRESGAGRKTKAVEVRQALYEWFIDVRGTMKARLPMKLFRTKAESLYQAWLDQQEEDVPLDERLKFSKRWIQGWLAEYQVSLRKPNKRFSISKDDRFIRITDYLKNIWMVRKYFIDTYGVDPPIINGDQMPLHRNESASQKTLSCKSEHVYVKENYMLSRERVTAFTQVTSDDKIKLLPEFVFKGKGTRMHLNPPPGVNVQWAPKGSYRLDNVLDMISKLPNRFNMFSQQNFGIYVLDDYTVHLMPEIRLALFKKGYVLVVIGGGVTGDIQINDTHCHAPLKANYREEEMTLMLRQLEENPEKIPSPSRDGMMRMLTKSWDKLDIDFERAFKSRFVTNALDGSEDYLVSDNLMELVGSTMIKFREELMKKRSQKTLQGVIHNLIPPKGVRRKSNVEGSELMDCEGGEIIDDIDEEIPDNEEENESDETATTMESSQSNPGTSLEPSSKRNLLVDLSLISSDPDIKADGEFLEKLHGIMMSHKTSKLFTPFSLQFKATYQKARRSLKRRIQAVNQKEEATSGSTTDSDDVDNSEPALPPGENEPAAADEFSIESSNEDEPAAAAEFSIESSNEDVPEGDNSPPIPLNKDTSVPKLGEYWEVRNGIHSLYVTIAEDSPDLSVFYFEQCREDGYYRLNDKKFEACLEVFVRKLDEPTIIPVGEKRLYYCFQD